MAQNTIVVEFTYPINGSFADINFHYTCALEQMNMMLKDNGDIEIAPSDKDCKVLYSDKNIMVSEFVKGDRNCVELSINFFVKEWVVITKGDLQKETEDEFYWKPKIFKNDKTIKSIF